MSLVSLRKYFLWAKIKEDKSSIITMIVWMFGHKSHGICKTWCWQNCQYLARVVHLAQFKDGVRVGNLGE